MIKTGKNIARLRTERGLTIKDLQDYFGFEQPQAIYKWQSGRSLPSVDNLFALSALPNVPMNSIPVPAEPDIRIVPVAMGAAGGLLLPASFLGRVNRWIASFPVCH